MMPIDGDLEQKDGDSSSIFVLWTIGYFVRGVVPRFHFEKIPNLRYRALLFLHGIDRYDAFREGHNVNESFMFEALERKPHNPTISDAQGIGIGSGVELVRSTLNQLRK